MLQILGKISNQFWNEEVWTPPNTTWNLYENNNYRHFNDIYYSLITALVLIVIRLTLERYEPILIIITISYVTIISIQLSLMY